MPIVVFDDDNDDNESKNARDQNKIDDVTFASSALPMSADETMVTSAAAASTPETSETSEASEAPKASNVRKTSGISGASKAARTSKPGAFRMRTPDDGTLSDIVVKVTGAYTRNPSTGSRKWLWCPCPGRQPPGRVYLKVVCRSQGDLENKTVYVPLEKIMGRVVRSTGCLFDIHDTRTWSWEQHNMFSVPWKELTSAEQDKMIKDYFRTTQQSVTYLPQELIQAIRCQIVAKEGTGPLECLRLSRWPSLSRAYTPYTHIAMVAGQYPFARSYSVIIDDEIVELATGIYRTCDIHVALFVFEQRAGLRDDQYLTPDEEEGFLVVS